MKIVAGMGCIDDYIRLVKAGADEVFCGYVPYEWNEKYGTLFPLNRREVLYYNVQIGCLEDMKILRKMVDVYKVPVTVTFNYIYYLEEQYIYIEKIIRDLIGMGFDEFIIADPALILYLEEKGINCSIHLSGECAEINRLSIKFFNKFKNITRYIFHRKNTIEDMESCIKENGCYELDFGEDIENNSIDSMKSGISNKKVRHMEYEAFVLNELCHYTGAFCSSLHCDELSHLCKIPYHISKINKECHGFKKIDERFEDYYNENIEEDYDDDYDMYSLGNSGCGLCALQKMKKAGVTHLKVVGRGKYIDYMERDVKNLKTALNILDKLESENKMNVTDNLNIQDTMKLSCLKFDNDGDDIFRKELKNSLFNHKKCSGECYYLK